MHVGVIVSWLSHELTRELTHHYTEKEEQTQQYPGSNENSSQDSKRQLQEAVRCQRCPLMLPINPRHITTNPNRSSSSPTYTQTIAKSSK